MAIKRSSDVDNNIAFSQVHQDKQCETVLVIGGNVRIRFHNRFIYVGVDISIYVLPTGGRI